MRKDFYHSFLVSLAGFSIFFSAGALMASVLSPQYWAIFIVLPLISVPVVVFFAYEQYKDVQYSSRLRDLPSFVLVFNAVTISYLILIAVIFAVFSSPYILLEGLIPDIALLIVYMLLVVFLIPLRAFLARYYFKSGIYMFLSQDESIDFSSFLQNEEILEKLGKGPEEGFLSIRYGFSSFLLVSYYVLTFSYFMFIIQEGRLLADYLSDLSLVAVPLLSNIVASVLAAYTCGEASRYIEMLN
jgi:hypothetical protein